MKETTKITAFEAETLRHMINYGFFWDDLESEFICWGVESKEYAGGMRSLANKGIVDTWKDGRDTYVCVGEGYTKQDILDMAGIERA